MKTHHRLSALLLLAAAGASPTLWAGNTAGQDLTMSVDPIGLIAIGNGTGGAPSITFNAPTVAGESFADIENPTVNNPTFPVAITLNVPNGKLKAKALVGTDPLSNYHLDLGLTPAGLGLAASRKNISSAGADTFIASVANMATGTLAAGTNGHQLTLDAASSQGSGGMLPYGSYTVTITYTLTGTGI